MIRSIARALAVGALVLAAGTLAAIPAATAAPAGSTSTEVTAAGKQLPASEAEAKPHGQSHVATVPAATSVDCPPGVHCVVVPAGLANGPGYTCNYTFAHRPVDTPILGVNVHTTEGTLAEALAEAQDTTHCVSWNYLVGQDGTVYVSVSPTNIAYTAGNWYLNSQYVQIEHIGSAEDCSTLTSAEFNASAALVRYLVARYHFVPSGSTIFGHDSVPGVDDAHTPGMHWDPGVCWPWYRFLMSVGASLSPDPSLHPRVILVRSPANQPTQDCPGANFTNCTPPAQETTNFLTLRTAPSTSAPLLSDPYLHPDGSPGSTAMQDWGDKAPSGHRYAVAERVPGWTAVWYSGQKAWFQNTTAATLGTRVSVVTPNGSAPVTVYGRPIPEITAPGVYNDGHRTVHLPYGWCSPGQVPVAGTDLDCIPDDLRPGPSVLTKYHMLPGQSYVVAQLDTPNRYVEGCDNITCTFPGDNVTVIGTERWYGIWFNHRMAYVRASDVTLSLA